MGSYIFKPLSFSQLWSRYFFFLKLSLYFYRCIKKTSAEEELEKLQEEEKTDSEKEPEKKKRKIGCTDEEVLAVLSHELGHWKLNHILKNLAIGQVRIFSKYILTFFLLC